MVSSIGCTYSELAGAIIRVMLGSIVLLAGTFKWGNGSAFMPLVDALGFPSRRLMIFGVLTLPGIEVLLGVWLFIGQWMTAALSITLLLFAGFTVALFILVQGGYTGRCACFGALDNHRIGSVHLGRNVILMLAATFALAQSITSVCVGGAVWNLPASVLGLATVLLVVTGLVYVLAAEVEAFFKETASQKLPTQTGGDKHG